MTYVRRLVPVLVAMLFLATLAACQQTARPTLSYPATKKGDVVDDSSGTKVADPYRWMEDLDSKDDAGWVAAENRWSFDYLGRLPMGQHLKQRIIEVWDCPK